MAPRPIKYKIGPYSGEERLDTTNIPEPDEDDDETQQAWFEDERNEPSFKNYIKNQIALYKTNFGLDIKNMDIIMIAQSHIDVCWLWRFEQTRKKGWVTFRKAVRMGSIFYPGKYTFHASQPQVQEYIKEDDPALFEQIKEQVKKGSFNIVGGSWVEPDCMMPSGEGFIHQRLYGMYFYQENYGFMPDIEWMMDSFGYGRNLPQILSKSGAKYFWTTKITWNKETIFPFVNFWWQSPDGSRVLAHEAQFDFGMLENFWKYECGRHLLKEGVSYIGDYTRDYDDLGDFVDDDALNKTIGLFYGKGDGGHGPTSQEVATAMALMEEGAVHVGTAKEFFTKLEKNSGRYPVWNDEMYLEYHQGTFTTHSRVKRNNRRLEYKAISVEMLCAIVSTQLKEASPYLKDAIDATWKFILKNQFHDCLPGSSIPEAYDEVAEEWELCDENLDKCIDGVAKAIAPVAKNEIILFNPNAAGEIRVFIPVTTFDNVKLDKDGRPPRGILKAIDKSGAVPLQPVAAEPATFIEAKPAGWWTVVGLDGIALNAFEADFLDKAAIDKAFETGIDVAASANSHLDNGILRVELAMDGTISKATSKNVPGVTNIFKGPSNIPMAFIDEMKNDQAWNITPGYNNHPRVYDIDQKPKLVVSKQGPIVSEITIIKQWGPQYIMQRIALYKGLPEIYCEFIADWNDPRTLVKLKFDTATGANVVESDNQYCIITRSTRPMTPNDKARWEKIQHKFSDLSTPDGKWGIAFLNDGKYAFDTMEPDVFRLTVLKSAQYPNAPRESFAHLERKMNMEKRGKTQPGFTDIGAHRTRFAFYPHAGATRVDAAGKPATDIVRRADMFNAPPIILKPGSGKGAVQVNKSLISSSNPSVLVKAVKKGHVDPTLLIVRAVEYTGNPASAEITVDSTIRKIVVDVFETDLLERKTGGKIAWDPKNGTVKVSFGKWEIKTIAFKLK
nr:glycoside hydrolase family 38 C-terminal domain-containing protein [Candidatus Sigynarchaeota archaeon]